MPQRLASELFPVLSLRSNTRLRGYIKFVHAALLSPGILQGKLVSQTVNWTPHRSRGGTQHPWDLPADPSCKSRLERIKGEGHTSQQCVAASPHPAHHVGLRWTRRVKTRSHSTASPAAHCQAQPAISSEAWEWRRIPPSLPPSQGAAGRSCWVLAVPHPTAELGQRSRQDFGNRAQGGPLQVHPPTCTAPATRDFLRLPERSSASLLPSVFSLLTPHPPPTPSKHSKRISPLPVRLFLQKHYSSEQNNPGHFSSAVS